jgi:hypothetical protein
MLSSCGFTDFAPRLSIDSMILAFLLAGHESADHGRGVPS